MKRPFRFGRPYSPCMCTTRLRMSPKSLCSSRDDGWLLIRSHTLEIDYTMDHMKLVLVCILHQSVVHPSREARLFLESLAFFPQNFRTSADRLCLRSLGVESSKTSKLGARKLKLRLKRLFGLWSGVVRRRLHAAVQVRTTDARREDQATRSSREGALFPSSFSLSLCLQPWVVSRRSRWWRTRRRTRWTRSLRDSTRRSESTTRFVACLVSSAYVGRTLSVHLDCRKKAASTPWAATGHVRKERLAASPLPRAIQVNTCLRPHVVWFFGFS